MREIYNHTQKWKMQKKITIAALLVNLTTMEGFYIQKSFNNIFNHVKNHPILSVIIISVIIASSLITIGLFTILSPLFSIPDFSLSSFRITNVDEGFVYAEFSFNFTTPIKNEISIKKIEIDLYQANSQEKEILASGNTLKPFVIKQNEIIKENISFIFEVPVIGNLLEVLLEEEKIGIIGRAYFLFGISAPFSYQPENIGISILPSIEILEVHPIPPGSTLEILVSIYNPHDIILNITSGKFDLIASEYGLLGNVTLTEAIIPPKSSNLTIYIHMEKEEMTWLIETILNNLPLQAEIKNLQAILLFGGEYVNVFMEDGPSFTWGNYNSSLDVQGIDNVSANILEFIFSFDISLGLLGMPLWGYNISSSRINGSSLSFELFYVIEGEPINVGNGSTNTAYIINRNEITVLNVHINVIGTPAVIMAALWLSGENLEIDVRNGFLILIFYDVLLQVSFELSFDV